MRINDNKDTALPFQEWGLTYRMALACHSKNLHRMSARELDVKQTNFALKSNLKEISKRYLNFI